MNDHDANANSSSDAERARALDIWLSAAIDDALADLDVAVPTDPDTPEIAARRAWLAKAAGRIGAVPPLDQLSRARLVGVALEALDDTPLPVPASAESTDPVASEAADLVPLRRAVRKVPRWLVPVGSAAAAIALIAGVAVSLGNGDLGGDDTVDSAAAELDAGARPDIEANAGQLPDYGDLSDPSTLRGILGGSNEAGRAGIESAPLGDPSNTVGKSTASTVARPPLTDIAADASQAEACLADLNPGGVVPTLVGTGTFEDQVVAVASAVEADATLVFVFPPENCTIVDFQLLANH